MRAIHFVWNRVSWLVRRNAFSIGIARLTPLLELAVMTTVECEYRPTVGKLYLTLCHIASTVEQSPNSQRIPLDWWVMASGRISPERQSTFTGVSDTLYRIEIPAYHGHSESVD